jgi:cell division ATPase FtsA
MIFKKESKTLGVAFDIGTASVSAALFELPARGTKPSIVKTYRKFHKVALRQNASHFSKATLNQLSAILKEIQDDQKGKMPQFYSIGLSSIFYLGKTERLHEQWPKAKTISQTDINNYIEKGKQKFFTDLKREDVIIFEIILMKSMLNGYAIERPVGKSAEEIELWMHFAATSKDLYDNFLSIVHGFRSDAKIIFATFPVNAWMLVRENIFPEHSVMLVDIGGELTEVTFVVDGVITEVLSLPFGVLNILLRIAESEFIEIENALSLLKTYTEGSLDKETAARIHGIIRKEMKSWEESFERAWQRASHNVMTTIRMFFLGGGALIDEMKNTIVPPLLHPDLARGLQASVISPDAFRDKLGIYAGFEGPSDFGLLSLILNSRNK